MGLPRVLICGDIVWAHEELQQMLGPLAEIVLMNSPTKAHFLEHVQSTYANVVGIYRHNTSADRIGVFDKELVAVLPESVKWIAHNGAGYDQIDIAACKARGIKVSNTPGAVDDATATTAMYLLISAVRQFSIAERNARAGKFKAGLKPAHDPSALTLGILGLGGIGLRLAHLARGFPMRILYYSRKPNPQAPEWCRYVESMDELLSTVDVLSLHVPLNAQTEGLIGEREFKLMKKGAILINTARGKVIDEEAFIKAIQEGQLSAAGIDVYPNEPHINPKLFELPTVTLLPHLGTETEESQRGMEVRALENLRTYLTGGKPKDLVWEMADLP